MMQELKKKMAETNLSQTENGALGYERHTSDIVTFFFSVSSMRNWDEGKIVSEFRKVLCEDKEFALRMLFYIRDVRVGLGERRVFRTIAKSLEPDTLISLLPLITEYGRWDDLIDIYASTKAPDVAKAAFEIVEKQLFDDISSMENGGNVSLLAKWMPSINNVAKSKTALAHRMCKLFGWSPKKYRQTLSALRAHAKVVERYMCAGKWSEINYSQVPSKANLVYSKAFMKHDVERRSKFLEDLKSGKKDVKINASALFPYEIVSRYNSSGIDDTLEEMWKSMSENAVKAGMKPAIIVHDGSGSMRRGIRKSSTTCADVADSLAILMSEHLPGEYRNRLITFSRNPKYVDLSYCNTLRDKIMEINLHCEIDNTDIEKVFDLVLATAKENSMSQENIPAIVIVSDMEFDESTYGDAGKPLFENISEKWKSNGYKIPKVVFWNVYSTTGTVPMQENECGVALVSGFSPAIFEMIQNDGTPFDIISAEVCKERYNPVSERLQSILNP